MFANSIAAQMGAPHRDLSAAVLGREVADLRSQLTGARRADVRHASLVDAYNVRTDERSWSLIVVLADDFKLKVSLPPEALKCSVDGVEAYLAPAILAAFRAEYPGAFFDFRGW